MTWVRLDDNIFDNPKIVEVSPLARLLHLAGICYSARHLTDGFIGGNVIARVHLQAGTTTKHVAELVAARLWHEERGGWVIHDYLEFNPSRQKVLDNRARSRERMANVRANSDGTSRAVRASRPDPSPKPPKPPVLTVVDNAKSRTFLPGSGWIEEAGVS